HVATGDVRRLDVRGQRLQPRAQPLERAARLALVARDDDVRRQVRQLLIGGSDDDDRRDDSFEQPDDTLQHGLGTERQHRLRGAHPRRLPAAENNRPGIHGYREFKMQNSKCKPCSLRNHWVKGAATFTPPVIRTYGLQFAFWILPYWLASGSRASTVFPAS